MKFKDTTFGNMSDKVWKGNIYLTWVQLTSLEGAPKEVKGDFECYGNNLKNLKYTPKVVQGDFICSTNDIATFIELPKIVNGNFDCCNNRLTQEEIDKLVQVKIGGEIKVSKGLIVPTKNDYKLYNRLHKDMKKFIKIKNLKAKLK